MSRTTDDAPWGPSTSTPIKLTPAKRPWLAVEEEDEGQDSTVIDEPHDSTHDPSQSMEDVSESSQILRVHWLIISIQRNDNR